MEHQQGRRRTAALITLRERIESDIFPSLKKLQITTSPFGPSQAYRTPSDYADWTMECERLNRVCKERGIEISYSEAPIVLEDKFRML
jgi:hypothetical protein